MEKVKGCGRWLGFLVLALLLSAQAARATGVDIYVDASTARGYDGTVCNQYSVNTVLASYGIPQCTNGGGSTNGSFFIPGVFVMGQVGSNPTFTVTPMFEQPASADTGNICWNHYHNVLGACVENAQTTAPASYIADVQQALASAPGVANYDFWGSASSSSAFKCNTVACTTNCSGMLVNLQIQRQNITCTSNTASVMRFRAFKISEAP